MATLTFELIPHSRPTLENEDLESVQRVFGTGMISSGELSLRFQENLAKFLGSPHVYLASSGTDALTLALKTLPSVEGGDVIIPTYVCTHVAEAVRSAGSNPIFADVAPNGTLSRESIEAVWTENTAAVIVVNIFGIQADVRQLLDLRVPIIEDSCQSFGSTSGGELSGTLGTLGVFSFHGTKLITTGEGGAVCTSDKSLAGRLEHLTATGKGLSDIQAALGLSQLSRFHEFAEARLRLYELMFESASEKGLKVVFPRKDGEVPFRFILEHSGQFGDVQRFFERRGVSIRRGVDALLHRFEGHSDDSFPNAVSLYNSVFSLPFFPSLQPTELASIESALEAYGKHLS